MFLNPLFTYEPEDFRYKAKKEPMWWSTCIKINFLVIEMNEEWPSEVTFQFAGKSSDEPEWRH